MSDTADQTRQRAATVTTATHDATASVQLAAAAAEQLSASITEIGRQVASMPARQSGSQVWPPAKSTPTGSPSRPAQLM
jgi:hypothetical protein